MKPWQKGIPLERLQAVAETFAAHEHGLLFGALSKLKENGVAAAIDAGHLLEADGSAAIARRTRQAQTMKAFTGRPMLRVPAGAVHIQRHAGSVEMLARALAPSCLDSPVVLEGWSELPSSWQLAELLGLELAGFKIRASSEPVAVWHAGCAPLEPLSAAELTDHADIGETPPEPATALLEELTASGLLDSFADHYSSYNVRHTWSALALRGYGGEVDFIEKPAEMSKQWKAEHPGALNWPVLWTPAAQALPKIAAAARALPWRLQRVRLMRLTEGGALSRHADITDREAGVADDLIARLHLPIVSPVDCCFQHWPLTSALSPEAGPWHYRMSPGRWHYLDTRKPHAAANPGPGDRIHLVADVHSDADLRARLAP